NAAGRLVEVLHAPVQVTDDLRRFVALPGRSVGRSRHFPAHRAVFPVSQGNLEPARGMPGRPEGIDGLVAGEEGIETPDRALRRSIPVPGSPQLPECL